MLAQQIVVRSILYEQLSIASVFLILNVVSPGEALAKSSPGFFNYKEKGV